MSHPMENVSFISVESGQDLIVSFAVKAPHDPSEIESLTLLRTPVYEQFLDEFERGVQVTFERHKADDEDELLEEVHWDHQAAVMRLKTRRQEYQLDLRRVDRQELAAMRKVLKEMNYDCRVQMSGV